jgi:hypothetical protein
VRLALAVLFALAAADENADLEKENEELQERLKLLQGQLKDAEQFTYVVSRGFISGAETIFMETMEVVQAKQWCNSNAKCRGFSFLAGDDAALGEPEDEVTVTFKGEPESGTKLKVEHDQAMISYLKESNSGVFGALGGAGMQVHGSGGLLSHGLTSQSLALAFALALLLAFACRRRCRGRSGSGSPLLPLADTRR